MADKKSLAEAVASIRRQKKIVKKSIAGIGRKFDVSATPETKALTSYVGKAIVDNPAPLQPLKRKLRLPKAKREPVAERLAEPVAPPVMEEKKEEPIVEEKDVKDPVVKIEKKPTKYRIKRNTMTVYL